MDKLKSLTAKKQKKQKKKERRTIYPHQFREPPGAEIGGGGTNGGGGENGGDPGQGRPVTGPQRSKLFAKL